MLPDRLALRATQLFDLLLTEDDRRNEVTRRRARFLRYSLLTTLVLSVVYAGCLFTIEYPIGGRVLVGYVVLHLFFLFLLWKKVRTAVVGNAFCTMSVVGFIILCATSGGIASATIIWFLATIVSGFWFVGRRAGYYWGGISLLTVVGLFVSEALGMRYPLAFPAKYHYIYAGIAYTGALLYAVVVVITYENWQISAIERAEGQAQELHAQKQEIETQRDSLQQVLRELHAAQRQLIQSAKMASLGELTAGIAHEIQNPLNFVNNFAEVSGELLKELQAKLAAGHLPEALPLVEILTANQHKIARHGQRATTIVKDMLAHSRTEAGEKRLVDFNALAEEYLRLAYHGFKAQDKTFNTKLTTAYDEQLGLVSCTPQELGRVVLNLCHNAFYAVNQQRRRQPAGYQPEVQLTTRATLRGPELCIRDNGPGIESAVLDKIFQPFFTTKPPGQGTGLGLSLSYDIVTAMHGGTLTVATEVGAFTEFSLRLPG